MKKGEFPRLDTLEGLLAEKRKHEGYLAKLEERRAGTPEHVFARLRDEYLTKLTDAQVRAAAEAEQIASALELDETAVREVETRLAQLNEEKIEGELRADVGELDAKDWQKRLVALNASISMAEKERDALTSNANRIRSLLTEALGSLPTLEQGSAPSASMAPESTPIAAAPKMRATTAIAGGPNFDELAFLQSVVGRPSSPMMPQPKIVEGPSAPSVSVPSASSSSAPELPLGTSAAEPAAQPAVVPSPAPAPAPRSSVPVPAPALPEIELEAPSAPEPASVTVPDPIAPAAPPATPAAAAPFPVSAYEETDEIEEHPSALGKPTPRTSQAIKTLKCGQCGSMNYPTEWYCERCGGELAAL